MVRGIADTPTFAVRIQQEENDTDEEITFQVLTINNHLLAYNDGWLESGFTIADAQTAVSYALRDLYVNYYTEQGFTAFIEEDTDIGIYVPPLEQFRGVIDATEQLRENYPVFANPAPVVCGFFTIESEANPALSGLCVELRAFKHSATNYVEVHASLMKHGGDYIAYRNAEFTTIDGGTSGVQDFVEEVANAYAQASLVGTGYFLKSFNIDADTTITNLPSAEFFTKIQAA